MSSISMPRARISVATMTWILPALKSRITSSRLDWSRSECISAILIFLSLNSRARFLTFNFDDENTITLWGGFSSNIFFRIGNFWDSWHMYADCLIFSAGFETASLISAGLCKILFAICCILGGIVAENSRVCLSFGSFDTICMMSS